MIAIRRGAKGASVKRWQQFLLGQGHNPKGVDGDFGGDTEAATIAFQQAHGLVASGAVDNATLGQAMLLGFTLVDDPANLDQNGPNWPPVPDFPPLVGTAARQKVFGKFAFVHDPKPDNFENIRITDNWESNNIVTVEIPQLDGIKDAPSSRRVRFHKLAANKLVALWQAWQDAGLNDRVIRWSGAFVPRFIRGSTSVLSNHAFGTAFDINFDWNQLGAQPALLGAKGSVRELVPIANEHGFYWGGHFKGRPDGMHFEMAVVP
jgi:hypothetical protein